MDGVTLGRVDRAAVVHGVAGDVEHASKYRFTDGHARSAAPVLVTCHAALESFGRTHGDGAHEAFAEVLLDLEGKLRGLADHVELDFQRVVDFRQSGGGGIVYVNDGADDLNDFAGVGCGRGIHRERGKRSGNLKS